MNGTSPVATGVCGVDATAFRRMLVRRDGGLLVPLPMVVSRALRRELTRKIKHQFPTVTVLLDQAQVPQAVQERALAQAIPV
jgi:hypothetical protein